MAYTLLQHWLPAAPPIKCQLQEHGIVSQSQEIPGRLIQPFYGRFKSHDRVLVHVQVWRSIGWLVLLLISLCAAKTIFHL